MLPPQEPEKPPSEAEEEKKPPKRSKAKKKAQTYCGHKRSADEALGSDYEPPEPKESSKR